MSCDKHNGSFKENSECIICGGCSEEVRELQSQLKEAEKVIELGDYWDDLKVNDYLKARREYKTKYNNEG
tara:strand:+ start:76 stop:285 length:210 start_codon:yes stop_codon:yes gene_type:complete